MVTGFDGPKASYSCVLAPRRAASLRPGGLLANILALCLLLPSGPSVFLLETINHAQQIKIVSERPLNDTLDRFRDKLPDDADDPRQEDIASLLLALVGSTAAFSLPSPDGSGNHVRGGVVKLDQFRPLVRYVVDNSPDAIIWAAVFSLINVLGPLTPPPSSIAPTFKGTPIKTSSSRLADSETRDIVEGELFEEIKKCTFRDVGRFWDKFFEPKSWRKEQKAMLKGIMTAHDGKKWTGFPTPPDEKPVWDWLRSLEDHFLADAPYKLHTTKTANQFKERKGQMDLFLQTPATEASSTFWYKDVLVVGEQKKSYDTSRFKADLLQLTRYVRSVFADQPTRRFIHAFSLCASKMELWVFDRSGAYSSGPFDIHSKPDKFARAFIGYTTMDDDAMGLDTFIEREDGYRYVRLDKAMVRQKAIVCRGTTCYETQNSHVAKFSWASDKRKLEVEQLKLAEGRGITTIAEMREGLEFPKPYKFRDDAVHFDDPPSATASANTSGNKRKSSSDYTSDNASGSKRRQSSSQKSKLPKEFNDQLSIGKDKPSLYTPDEDLWENRIYSCLVVSPAGRVISDFKTTKELLESMRDAIKAHQSLYMTGNILHRDISSNNIIITEPETADGFKGMLIDLDLAKVKDSGPSGARHQTGTMQFMAVEVLRTADHTYRHDLESFFYVLLWMCARQSWSNGFAGEERPPKESLLRRWEIGSFKYIAAAKEGDMTVNRLEGIMGEFPEAFDVVKPLCLRIRSIMFGDTARLSFGTPTGDPDQLYRPMIAAYDEAISKL
ncbi:serine/threonine-protein kinase Sgk2 [Xylaria acuta]|nr:serine/threonine-protein kinase Sgk2 [Xylaria acuta]